MESRGRVDHGFVRLESLSFGISIKFGLGGPITVAQVAAIAVEQLTFECLESQ